LCRSLVDDGISTVIATPHQLGRYNDGNEAYKVRQKVAELNRVLESEGVGLKVLAGGDVRVDERICRLLEDDKVLTLGDGGRFILLELPHQIFIDIEPLLIELLSIGVRAVISHPERHFAFSQQHNVFLRWLEH
jgi:protein-tyrosine phosphatase